MMEYRIAQRTNLVLAVGLVTLNVFIWLGLPFLLYQSEWWAWFLLLGLLLTNTFWSLIHEAIHYLFCRKRSFNIYFGRLMALSFGTVFQVVQFGHLQHHRFNRTELDRGELYDPATEKRWQKNIHYYLSLLGLPYWLEVVGPLVFWLPRPILRKILVKIAQGRPEILVQAERQWFSREQLWAIRVDAGVLWCLMMVAFYSYGANWPLLLAFILLRGCCIAFSDNLPHYATPYNEVRYAFNLKAPKWLEMLLLRFNYHRVHHQHPNVPWVALTKKFAEEQDTFDRPYFNQGMRQWRGVLTFEQLQAMLVDQEKE